MISVVKGSILSVNGTEVEVMLSGSGIALSLGVPLPEKLEQGKEATFYTYLHWNADNGPSLFGFEERAQRALFVAAISCSGIGPKMGIAIVEQLGAEGFISAVQNHDVNAMSSVSGIGAKKAEQIIVQLKHKIDKLAENKDLISAGGFGHAVQIREVLSSLSYSSPEIAKAIDHAKHKSSDKTESFDVALRRALAFLSKNV